MRRRKSTSTFRSDLEPNALAQCFDQLRICSDQWVRRTSLTPIFVWFWPNADLPYAVRYVCFQRKIRQPLLLTRCI